MHPTYQALHLVRGLRLWLLPGRLHLGLVDGRHVEEVPGQRRDVGGAAQRHRLKLVLVLALLGRGQLRHELAQLLHVSLGAAGKILKASLESNGELLWSC